MASRAETAWRILAALLLASTITLAACDSDSKLTRTGCKLPRVDRAGDLVVPDSGAEATVVFFVATDCPISNYFAPEMERIRADYEPLGVEFRLVYAVPGEDEEAIREHLGEYGLTMPAVLDPEHALLTRVGASVTPEAAVFSKHGELVYHGRIDDTYVAYGRQRPAPTRRDLRLALDAVLDGALPEPAVTEPIGCFIPDLEGSSLPAETATEDR